MVPVSATALVDRTAEVSEGGAGWLREAVVSLEVGRPGVDIASVFAEAGRRVGRGRLAGTLPPDPAEPLAILDAWSADDAARAAILLAIAAGRSDELAGAVEDLYATGDGREKAAIVRALVLLPDAQRFVPIALD